MLFSDKSQEQASAWHMTGINEVLVFLHSEVTREGREDKLKTQEEYQAPRTYTWRIRNVDGMQVLSAKNL